MKSQLLGRVLVPSALISIVLICRGTAGQPRTPELQGPVFDILPPREITFANTKGTQVECSASGSPKPSVQWELADGSPMFSIPGLRELDYSKNVLVLKPFSAEQYRPDVHAITYRCSVNNSIGTIVSNDVHVRGVVFQPYDVQVYDSFAIEGNTAVFKCHIPEVLREFITVSAWIKNDNLLIQTSDSDTALDKYMITPSGELHIHEVSLSETGSRYKCKTTHNLVSESIISKSGGRLFVTAPHGNVATKIVDLQANVDVTLGETAVITCIAQGFPVPSIMWYRKDANGKIIKLSTANSMHFTKSTLAIKKVKLNDEGSYICEASSEIGKDQADIFLKVKEPLQVVIQPQVLETKHKESAAFHCMASGSSKAKFTWFHNGKLIPNEFGSTLNIQSVEATNIGMYQCMVESDGDRSQAAVELRLSDIPPKLLSTFNEFTLQPGSRVTLQCSATGLPIPVISWDVDGIHVEKNANIQIVTSLGTSSIVISSLTIQSVLLGDGGLYSCTAINQGGDDKYSARINVFGPVRSRNVPPVDAVSGSDVYLNCPYIGHPVSTISWQKDGKILRASSRQKLFKNGTVLVKNAHKSSNAGIYLCSVMTPEGNKVDSKVELSVLVAPKIVPFWFQEELLREGMRARLQCVVSEGDLPLTITWMKDGKLLSQLSPDPAVNVRVLDDFSSILTVSSINPRHNGNYTCVASNMAASISHTAQLAVNVAPKIVPFSFQDVHFEGSTARLVCGLLEGDLPVQFFWLKNDIPIESSIGGSDTSVSVHNFEGVSSILTIKNIKAEHAGNYTCLAKNRVASTKLSSVLVVNVAPKIAPFSFQGEHLFEGAVARITCVVYQGDLPLTMEWLKDGVQVMANVAGVEVRQIDEYTSILTIDSVSLEHAGNYTCMAKNRADATSHSAVLSVNVPPKIVPFAFDDHLLEGNLARVSCVISRGDLPLSINWEKDGEAIPGNLGVVVRSFDVHSSILTIESVAEKHNGQYACIASNAAGTATFPANMVVKVPPLWVVMPMDASVLSGQQVTLDCQATGYPKPEITWLHTSDPSEHEPLAVISDEKFIILNNGSLRIHKVDKSIAGYFLCEVSNGIGVDLSAMVLVKIHAPPSLKTKFQMASVAYGKEYTMNCIAEGDSAITALWYKEGRQLLDNPLKYRIVTSESASGISSSLTFMKATRHDQGRYECIVENIHGKNNMTFEVVIQDRPDSPKEIKVTVIGSRMVELSWQKSFDGNDPVNKYIIEYINEFEDWEMATHVETASGEIFTGIVANLKPATHYLFRMFAENAQGRSKPSSIFKGTTPEEAPSVAPENILVSSNNDNMLTVTWAKPLDDNKSQNDKVTGYYIGFKEDGKDEAYSFKTLITSDSENREHSVHLMNLKKFTKYAVVVQAYNEQGKGPLSPPVIVMTSEGVPSIAPLNVRCTTLSSQSIHVTWDPPHANNINGILSSYKIMYKAASGWYEDEIFTINSNIASATLSELEKYTNYSIEVSTATKVGAGPVSEPIYCKTLDDVPDAPSDIKVVLTSETSVLVTWKLPLKANGIIKNFNVYHRPAEKTHDVTRNTLPAQYTQIEIPGLKKGERYEFWVKASTLAGEGKSSNIVTQSPYSNTVAARVIPFDEKVTTPWRSDVTLSCQAVGSPVPLRSWYRMDEIIAPNDRLYITNDGSLVIKGVLEEDSGDYYCLVNNDLNEDRVTYTIIVQVPPSPPTIEVIHSSSSSIEIKWKISQSGSGRIKGYILHVRREFGDWKEISLDADVASYKLNGLDCGTNYEIVMAAFNKIGLGDKSRSMLAPTNGSAPGPPPKEDLLEETATSVSINLNAWKIHSCPILYYIVEYKVKGTGDWVFAANNVKPEQKRLVVRDLMIATWYRLRITAHSSAGSAVAEYDFATLTITGATISPNVMLQDEASNMSSSPKVDLWVAISVILSLLLVILVLALICFYVKKKRVSNGEMTREVQHDTLSRPHTQFGTMSSTGIHDDPMPYATCHLSNHMSASYPLVPHHELDVLNSDHHGIMLADGGFVPGVQCNPLETTFIFQQMPSGMTCFPQSSSPGFPPRA